MCVAMQAAAAAAVATAAAAAATAVTGENVNDWLVLANQKAHIFFIHVGQFWGLAAAAATAAATVVVAAAGHLEQSRALQHQAELQILVF